MWGDGCRSRPPGEKTLAAPPSSARYWPIPHPAPLHTCNRRHQATGTLLIGSSRAPAGLLTTDCQTRSAQQLKGHIAHGFESSPLRSSAAGAALRPSSDTALTSVSSWNTTSSPSFVSCMRHGSVSAGAGRRFARQRAAGHAPTAWAAAAASSAMRPHRCQHFAPSSRHKKVELLCRKTRTSSGSIGDSRGRPTLHMLNEAVAPLRRCHGG